jgi:hypothetical protein
LPLAGAEKLGLGREWNVPFLSKVPPVCFQIAMKVAIMAEGLKTKNAANKVCQLLLLKYETWSITLAEKTNCYENQAQHKLNWKGCGKRIRGLT